MDLNKGKLQKEYIVLVFAWLFWAIAEVVSWKYYNHKILYSKVITIKLLQMFVALVFNIIVIRFFLIIQKNNIQNNSKFVLYTISIVIFSIIIVVCNSSIYMYFMDNTSLIYDLHNVFINVLQKIIYLTGFTTLFFMIRNLKELQYQKQKAISAQKLATESQLQLLQQQINPHFLFNTLNSLRNLISSDTQKARNMVNYISEFLRESLLSNNATTKLVSEEIIVLDNYLNIQKIRWGNDLIINKDIGKGVLDLKIPSLMLQPLAENAIKHGMVSNKILTINISIKKQDNTLFISVSNNGKLTKPNKTESGGNTNITKRLDLLYGNNASFEMKALNDTVYSTITIKL
ncbi:hypothetical protein MHTCC0001_03880 [Flavobacteriaceae bacterium MHTCC 0001]